MRFLLDTVTFLFAATSDRRLSAVARGIIEDPEDPVYLSAVSLTPDEAVRRYPVPTIW